MSKLRLRPTRPVRGRRRLRHAWCRRKPRASLASMSSVARPGNAACADFQQFLLQLRRDWVRKSSSVIGSAPGEAAVGPAQQTLAVVALAHAPPGCCGRSAMKRAMPSRHRELDFLLAIKSRRSGRSSISLMRPRACPSSCAGSSLIWNLSRAQSHGRAHTPVGLQVTAGPPSGRPPPGPFPPRSIRYSARLSRPIFLSWRSVSLQAPAAC